MNSRSFLPLFFVLLGAVLAVAVGLRIRAYNRSEGEGTAVAVPDGNGTSGTYGTSATYGQNRTAATSPDAPASRAAAQQQVTNSGTPIITRPGVSREQRYAEALAAAEKAGNGQPQRVAIPPPAAAPRPAPAMSAPKEQPGLLARIGNAISNAFGGSSSRSTTAPQQNANPPHESTRAKEQSPPEKLREKDPTSDTTPPQILGVIFQPQVINDGQETACIITATDDLSGVRNVSGSVASPSGKALQGFAAQRESPDSNRYVARILIPKQAEQGLWRINFLSVTDNASNTTNINSSWNGGVGFTVNSAQADSTPPTLRNVYLDRRSMSGGEKNTLFVQATDDKSGVKIISGVFQSPSKAARIGFGCRQIDPENFACDIVAPQSVDCGEWQLEQVQLQDAAQNMATVRYTDNPMVANVKLTMLADNCDSTPPTVESLTLDPLVTTANGIVTVTAIVTDDRSGVASISGQAAGPPADNNQPPRVYFAFQQADKDNPQLWVGKIQLPPAAAKGTWSIVWMQALDKSNNMKIYSQADPVLKNTQFTVR